MAITRDELDKGAALAIRRGKFERTGRIKQFDETLPLEGNEIDDARAVREYYAAQGLMLVPRKASPAMCAAYKDMSEFNWPYANIEMANAAGNMLEGKDG